MDRSVCCAVLLWAAVSMAAEEPRAEFTATYRFTGTRSRSEPRTRALYVGRDAIRLDDPDGSGFQLRERRSGRVTHVDLKRSIRERSAWGGWPREVAPGEPPCGVGATCVKMKTEVRDGRRVEKWKEMKPECPRCRADFIWVDRSLGFEVRHEYVGIEVHELTNIRRGAPPAHLLTIPAGLRDPLQPDASEAAVCKRQGGTYERGVGAGWWQCNLPMKDAGKECSDGEACQSGVCVAPKHAPEGTRTTGTCQGMRWSSDCRAKVSGGVVQPTICP